MSRRGQQEKPHPTRREFARTLAVLAAAPLAIAAGPVSGQAAPEAKPKPSDPAADAIQALAELARARYGKFLTEDQMKAVKRHLSYSFLAGQRLKQFKLQNSDEPAFLFRADLP